MTISEKVKLIIASVTREGLVTVKFRPFFKSNEWPLKLSNQTVNFYIEKWNDE